MPNSREARIILISGAGKGKSHIGNLLEKDYREKAIPCRRFCAGGKVELMDQLSEKVQGGYIIIETNLPSILKDGPKPWQHIVLS